MAGVGAWCLRPGESATSRLLGGAVTPPAAALAVWAFADVAGLDEALRGYPVLLTVGLLALALPRPEVEATGMDRGAGRRPAASIQAAADPVTATAVHLTVAGALVVASSLVNPQRRALGWVGGLLLAAATWVRLADLGVEAPEAYTLPSALALLVVGLDRLRRDPETPTSSALTPGLLLATVPSLLWCLEDPVTWRAAWLGVACVGLVLAGTLARWHAPLVVGGTVGGAAGGARAGAVRRGDPAVDPDRGGRRAAHAGGCHLGAPAGRGPPGGGLPRPAALGRVVLR